MSLHSRAMKSLLVVALVAYAASVCIAQEASTLSASPLGNKDPGKTETTIGNLVADAVRSSARTDIAFIAASELKPKDPPIAAGTVNASDLAALISYKEDTITVLSLTGKQIKLALEKAVSIYPQPNLGFLQVSGLSFTFTPSKSAGERVTSIAVNGGTLSDSASYTVAVTNTMANGALGYWKIWSKDNIRGQVDTTIAKAIDSYFKANPNINYASLGRISVN